MTRRALAAALLAALAPSAFAAGEDGPSAAASASAPAADPQEAYVARSVAAKTARDRYALGLWCRGEGLVLEAAAQFREALRIDPGMDAAREELGERKVDGRWVSPVEAMAAKGLVRHDGRWVLPEEKALLEKPAAERERLAREGDRARKLIEAAAAAKKGEAAQRAAVKALEGVEDAAKFAPLCFALRSSNRDVQFLAAAELGRMKDRRALRPLVHRALHDADGEVRAACVDAARAVGDPELLAPFATALLDAKAPAVRAAAAEAVGRLGDLRGVTYLVYAIEGHGGGGRAYIYTANQLSFVQDFDVEVAQTAFIADPQIGTLQDGAVLDAQVVASEWYSTRVERQALVGGLRRLTGAEIGDDAKGWRAWAREHAKEIAAVR